MPDLRIFLASTLLALGAACGASSTNTHSTHGSIQSPASPSTSAASSESTTPLDATLTSVEHGNVQDVMTTAAASSAEVVYAEKACTGQPDYRGTLLGITCKDLLPKLTQTVVDLGKVDHAVLRVLRRFQRENRRGVCRNTLSQFIPATLRFMRAVKKTEDAFAKGNVSNVRAKWNAMSWADDNMITAEKVMAPPCGLDKF
jgi:hypothetical protein